MSDEPKPLTDEELERIASLARGLIKIVSTEGMRDPRWLEYEITVAIPEGREGPPQVGLSAQDALRLVAEVRRLRALVAAIRAVFDEHSFPEDREEAIATLLGDDA